MMSLSDFKGKNRNIRIANIYVTFVVAVEQSMASRRYVISSLLSVLAIAEKRLEVDGKYILKFENCLEGSR